MVTVMPADNESKETDDEGETVDGIGLVRAQQILGQLVNRAGFGGERVPILRNRKPIAYLVGVPDMERLRSTDAGVNL